MADLAYLGMAIESAPARTSANDLRALTAEAVKTEAATEKMAASATASATKLRAVGGATDQLRASLGRIEALLVSVDRKMDGLSAGAGRAVASVRSLTEATTASAQEQARAVSSVDRLTAAIERQAVMRERAKRAASGSSIALRSDNDNAVSGRRQNLGYQLFDVLQSAPYAGVGTIGLQQGPQLLQNYIGNGGFKAATDDLGAIANGAVSAGAAIGGMLGPLGLVATGFGAAGVAALAYYSMSAEQLDRTEEVLTRHQRNIEALKAAWGAGADGLKAFNEQSVSVLNTIRQLETAKIGEALRYQVPSAVEALRSAGAQAAPAFGGARSFRSSEIYKFVQGQIDTLQHAELPDFTTLREQLSAMQNAHPSVAMNEFARSIFEATTKGDELNRALPNAEKSIGSFATSAQAATAPLSALTKEVDAYAKALDRIKGIAVPQLSDTEALEKAYGSLGSTPFGDANDAALREYNAARQRITNQQAGALAPTPTERPNYEDYLANQDKALAKQASAYDRTIERANERLTQMRNEISLFGQYGPAVEAARYEQELLAQAIEKGVTLSPDQRRAIKDAATAYGQLADQMKRLRLADDLRFDAAQFDRSPTDQRIAQRLRGTGIGMDSPEAEFMRRMDVTGRQRNAVEGAVERFGSELINSGGDIGKSFGKALLAGLQDAAMEGWRTIGRALGQALFGAPAAPGGTAVPSLASAGISAVAAAAANDNVPGAAMGGALADRRLMSGDVASQAWGFFKSKGLSDYAAAGMLGQISAESGFNPKAIGDGGLAHGLFQHHPNRGGNMSLIRSGAMGQLEHAWAELQGPESGVLARLQSATDLRSATRAAIGFERPLGWSMGNPEAGHNFTGRLDAAAQAMDRFGGSLGQLPNAANVATQAVGTVTTAVSNIVNGATGGKGWSLANLFGTGLSNTGAGFLDGRGGGFRALIGYADGTPNAPGGPAVINERGRGEIVDLPSGARVYPHDISKQIASRVARNSAANDQNANQNRQPPKIDLHVTVVGGSGDDHIRKLAQQGAQAAIGEYHQGQISGGFGETQKRYVAQKG